MFYRRRRSFRPHLDAGSPATLKGVVDRVIAYLAGGLAERRALGCFNRLGAADDRQGALKLVSYIEPDASGQVLLAAWLWSCADRLVAQHWEQIAAVARALLERRTLKGREIDAIINGTLQRRSTRKEAP